MDKWNDKKKIVIKNTENIIYKCMNIVVQVASQLSCIDKAYFFKRNIILF